MSKEVTEKDILRAKDSIAKVGERENSGLGLALGLGSGVALAVYSLSKGEEIDAASITSAVITAGTCGYIGNRIEDAIQGNAPIQQVATDVAVASSIAIGAKGFLLNFSSDNPQDYDV